MSNDGVNTLTYDAENHAVSVTSGSASGAYTYDGSGLRVKKVSGATTTVYIFSGTKVIAEYDNGAVPGSPSREYIYSGGALLAKLDSTGTKYYHQDHLSNRLVTDSSGNTAAQMGHYPFGESWYNASNDKLLFTSYERDSESGNDYAQARYYLSRLGRFSSPDRLSGSTDNPQSLNRYSYVLNVPTSLVDPTGEDPCDFIYIVEHRRRRTPTLTAQLGPSNLEESDAAEQEIPIAGCGGTGGNAGGVADLPLSIDSVADTVVPVTADAPPLPTSSIQLPDPFYGGGPDGPGGAVSGSGGGPGGNTSGDQRQKQIGAARSTLYDALLNDPDCLSFLAGRGAMPLGTLSTISINHDYIGGQSIQAQTNNAGPDPTALVPRNPSITINDNGGFFTRGLVTSGGMRSGTLLFQGSVLLHELGHATGVLLQDGQGVPNAISNQATNEAALKQHCAKTLASLPNR